MSQLLNIGTRALQANLAGLQTTGHNIANVNTPGYSRQSVVLRSVEGQFSGSGYYGKGVEVSAVLRNHSEFLTRQSTLSGAVAASDGARLTQLKQLEDVFQGGPNGLGAAVSDMLNSFSDVRSAPTDLTARAVALTRVDEMGARFRTAAIQLDDLKQGVASQLQQGVAAVNSLAGRIAAANDEISRTTGSGQAPNDLLDQRDALITQLNKYVQTTNIAADDGSVGVFLASSHPLVLGTQVSKVALQNDSFSDPSKTKLAITRASGNIEFEEATLGGGEIAGLLRFQNSDLVDAGNLLGRLALAIGTQVNQQHRLGLDLAGNPGGDLFRLAALPPGLAASGNSGNASLGVAVQTSPAAGSTALAASNYEVNFSSSSAGFITRLSDGQLVPFDLSVTSPAQIDGLDIQISSGAAVAGDRFLLRPFADQAASIERAFSSPRSLAMASAVAAQAGAGNQGTLTLERLSARQPDPDLGATVTLTFTGPGSFDVTGTGSGIPALGQSYTPGQPISYNGWELQLKGSPQAGDSYTVQANAYPGINAGNAESIMDLRDLAMFDGAALTDGYASAIAQIGVRVQGAGFAAEVSQSIAANIASDRAGVSGVNLDEEAAKLLQFQQSYQASAKMLQAAQNVFDTLMQSVGR